MRWVDIARAATSPLAAVPRSGMVGSVVAPPSAAMVLFMSLMVCIDTPLSGGFTPEGWLLRSDLPERAAGEKRAAGREQIGGRHAPGESGGALEQPATREFAVVLHGGFFLVLRRS